jgi:hypothetical protein
LSGPCRQPRASLGGSGHDMRYRHARPQAVFARRAIKASSEIVGQFQSMGLRAR